MDLKPGASQLAVQHAFLIRVLSDREAGNTRTLEEYQKYFPGHEDEVERLFVETLEPDGAEEPSGSPDPDGVGRFGRFLLLRELGRGGQGVVYLAEDTRLRRRVALKVLLAVFDPGGDLVRRFKREAEAAGRIEHPGVCAVHEAGEVDGTLYIAMRYVEGNSLAQSIAVARQSGALGIALEHPRRLTPDSKQGNDSGSNRSSSRRAVAHAVQLLEHVARAVHAAHEAGVVHRDLKPGNIMVTPEGEPVVLDFGLARAEEQDGAPALTRTGELFGTPAYMAPEQIEAGRGPPDRRTDVYSLGATLHECLTLRPPFESPTREGLYRAILDHELEDPRRVNPAISPDLRVVLETALAKDPDARYRTAHELAEELRRVRTHEPIVARRAGPLLRLGRWVQRRPALAAALAGVFLSLLAALAVTTAYLQESRASLAEIRRLADHQLMPYLERRAERELWPAVPEKVEAMDAWLVEAEGLLARRQALGYGIDTSRLEELIPNVAARRQHAVRLGAESMAEHRAAWGVALAEIRDSAVYGGVDLTARPDLVPLGADPDSGLQEFAFLQFVTPGTGHARVPWRDAGNGKLSIGEDTLAVFVLLPGGEFWMGAQATDPQGRNYVPEIAPECSPPHTIELDPFFLSKYEMTQAQWLWATAHNPSSYFPGRTHSGYDTGVTLQNPVEVVSWRDCAETLERLGLAFPTEAQWEYACRAGTGSIWSTGDDPLSLAGHANLADEGSRGFYYYDFESQAGLFDGAFVHAPVGSYAPNGFGLHDMHGNVREWCRDLWLEYGRSAALEGTGERVPLGPLGDEDVFRSYRGGSFRGPPNQARSAGRPGGVPDMRMFHTGLRPALNLHRGEQLGR